LGPDQVLVLVNGKRRHSSALVHVNGSVGRGSTGVDLNAIPPSAIEKIEILRDGAAAQYGSDAIAGVINVVRTRAVAHPEREARHHDRHLRTRKQEVDHNDGEPLDTTASLQLRVGRGRSRR
jgi:iron complex outermembrane receptor protein